MSKPLKQFEIYLGQDGDYRWRLVHRNGKVLADSGEGYKRKVQAKKAAQAIADLPSETPIVEIPLIY